MNIRIMGVSALAVVFGLVLSAPAAAQAGPSGSKPSTTSKSSSSGGDYQGDINGGVNYHNIAATGLASYFPAHFVLRSPRGEVLGGLLGLIWGGWLKVSALWVADAVRRHGHGGRLLAAAEAYALERGSIGDFLRGRCAAHGAG